MIIDRIKFTKEFNYRGASEWMGCEASLELNEDATQAILQMRQKMIETFNAATTEEVPTIQEKKPVPPGMQFILDKINKCTTPEQLEKERVRADMNPDIKKVFNQKLKELQS